VTEKKPADGGQRTISICQGTGCVSGKSLEITQALNKQIAELGLEGINVDFTGCHGFCEQGPLAIVEPDGIFYTHVTLEDVPEILIVDVPFEIGHSEEDHLRHVAGRILHLHRRDGKKNEQLHGLQSYPLLIRILKNPRDFILISIIPFFHKRLGFGHLPDTMDKMVENGGGTEKFLGRFVDERRDIPFRISFQSIMDEVDDPPMFGEEGPQSIKEGNGRRMDRIQPKEPRFLNGK